MLSPADLPGCMSVTHSFRRQLRSFASLAPRFLVKGVVRRSVATGFLGLSLSAALMGDALVPAVPAERVLAAPAAAFALTSMTSAYLGDVAIADPMAVESDDSVSGTLDFGAPVQPIPSTAKTSDSAVNIRRGPSTKFASLGKLAKGAKLTVLGQQSGWYRVKTARGTIGWVVGDYLLLGGATTSSIADNVASYGAKAMVSSRAATAVRVAANHVGARYIYGGAGPRGFDCSGLVQYAYRNAGVSLPHKASAMFNTRYGARIHGMGSLKAGDIVFFANTAGRGITHVALYVGGGKMITANSPRTGVTYASINTKYWRAHYAGAIRPH